MNTEKAFSLDWMVWLQWVLATTIGLFISEFLGYMLGTLLNILAGGLIIGTLQWLFVLRSQQVKSGQWIWCSAIGWALGYLVGSNVTSIALFIHGIVLGFSQWFFFIRKMYPTSFWWVLINAVSLPMTFLLSWRVIFPVLLGGYDGALSGPADTIVRGVLFGAITGFYLMWLMSRPQMATEAILPNTE